MFAPLVMAFFVTVVNFFLQTFSKLGDGDAEVLSGFFNYHRGRNNPLKLTQDPDRLT